MERKQNVIYENIKLLTARILSKKMFVVYRASCVRGDIVVKTERTILSFLKIKQM